ncbi:DNA-binding protein [Phyllobacterium phragmitis]|uniref:DNA-binding protein n=1 Tax=Phyllobacterium phragmitis TaxID=2670329 RepID=A0A2S9IJ97_9HYPH|nr:helix-turn-helix domain-containing protein [Phyllobacterium phragmitis]PRD40604.1 DNA-binding protein [Phyllobacterium phragmitis]
MDDEISRAATARKGSPFLNTAQAAFYIGLYSRTLEKLRIRGGGPKYRKHGRYVRYHIDELDDWSKDCTRDAVSEGAQRETDSSDNGNRP